MFTILDRYIGRTILNTIIATLLLLVGLSGIIRFVDQLRKTRVSYDALSAGLYSVLTIPKDIETFFPMAALLGGLLGLGALAMRSELVVMEASGFTRSRIALAVMKTAIPLVIITMIIGEWVAPVSEQTARNMRAEKIYGRNLLATQTGVWAKEDNSFIYIGHVDDKDSLSNISIYRFNDTNHLDMITHADRAKYLTKDKNWQLLQVTQTDLTNANQIKKSQLISLSWSSNLTPDKLGVVAVNPESLSATGLYGYINYLKNTGQEYHRYSILFWGKIVQPLSVAVMMLMALSFIFGPLRGRSMGSRIVTGIACGFIFYMLDQIFSHFSIIYNIPPLLGASLPSIIFLAIGVYILKYRH